MNPFFTWLKDSGTQATLVLLGTVAACIAACAAIYYGRKSLTREDLKEVEDNTAHLEEVRTGISTMNKRLVKQEEAEGLKNLANRVSIVARGGNQAGSGPYRLEIQVRHQPEGTNVSLTHIELLNESNTPFGSSPCTSTGTPGFFIAEIPMNTMGSWFHGGTPDANIYRMRLKLTVTMSINGVSASRDMAVLLVTPINLLGYTVEGNV